MSVNVSELMSRINSIVAQESTAPTAGGEDWNLYLKYLNLSQQEWQESYPWPSLYKEVSTLTSQSTGLATIDMPADLRKLSGFPIISWTDGGQYEYPQIDPQKRSMYGADDKYHYILGYPGAFKMVVNPASHGSGASIYYSYWAEAPSLASGDNVSLCPDPNYLVQKSVAYLWEARDDGRFPQAKAEAEKILSRMLEFEVSRGYSYDDRVDTVENSRYGFRIGRD